MRIGVAQISTRAGDFAQTARQMVECSERAARQGVDLLVFPMTALCGASSVGPVDREGFLLDLAGCVLGLAEDLACPCLVPVLTDMGGTSVPDALLIRDSQIVPVGLAARIEAMAAAAQSEPVDERSGTLPELELAGARLGVAFTYDDLDVYVDYEYDVDVIVFLSGYGFAVDDPSSALGTSLTEGRFMADAEATGAWIVGVGSLGCYDAQVFCGSSFVLAPWGELAAQAPSLEEALLVCDVDPSAEGPLEAPLTPEVYDAPLMTWSALAAGLAGTVRQLGAGGACVVVDDTLASMVVATLATDALGPTNVGVVLTGEGGPAAELVRALRIPAANVEALELPGGARGGSGEKDRALAADFAQARLAALARRTSRVPLGTLDKTGLALEERTFADAARLHPLADLYRSDVVSLAQLRNTISPVMPAAALASYEVPDVEGLAEALGSDETRLEFVDLVLSSHLEWELPVSDVAAERGHAELVEAILARLREVDSRRAGEVRAITLSSRTLAEARGPVGLAWHDVARPEEERLAGRLSALADQVGDEGDDGPEGEGREAGGERESHEREVRDLLGYLRDFSAGGGFSPMEGSDEGSGRHGSPGQGEGPQGPFWDGPFSEN